jgi:hypothetical protein
MDDQMDPPPTTQQAAVLYSRLMKDKMTSEQAFKFVEEMGYSKPL